MAQPVKKIDIKDILNEGLVREIGSLKVEPFRTGQILEWVYKGAVSDFDKMTNLPLPLRQVLKERFYISDLELVKQLDSSDGTKKFLFKLEDNEKIESVFIPSKKTNTICISSQVGCRFSCSFCASGKGGFVRNLRPAEMVNQALFLRAKGFDITNVVFMGMGEPLDNYESVLNAVRILNAPYGLGIGQRKITISTCGLVPQIKKLASEGLQIELSISLHSPNDKIRSTLLPINKKYSLTDLIKTCKEYIDRTNRQITFEYVLIKEVNDSKKDAGDLAELIKGMLVKVNLIPLNPLRRNPRGLPPTAASPGIGFSSCEIHAADRISASGRGSTPLDGLDCIPPSSNGVKEFKAILDKKGIISTIRVSRGTDIDAACGQLRLTHEVQ